MSFGDAVKGDWGWLIVGGLVFVVGVALAVGILEGAMGDAGTVPSPAFCCDAPATGGTAVECTDGLTKRGGLGRYDDQCELPDYSRGVVQTWATWSNLPFILFGLLIALRNGWSFKDTDMPGVAVASTFVGITFILIGAMSMAFHGQMTPSTQDLDIWAIYFGLLALLATTLVSTWAQLRESWWGAALLCLIAFGGFVAYARSDVKFFQSEYFVPFLAGLVIVAMILRLCWAIKDDADGAWHARFWVPFGLALAFLGAGAYFKFSAGYDACPRDLFLAVNAPGADCTAVFDSLRPKDGCGSCTGWGPHSWWHVFAALGLFAGFEAQAPREHRVVGI